MPPTTHPIPPADLGALQRSVRVLTETALLDGDLAVPDRARGVVLFAHGSGSSRHSPRNRSVAAELNRGGLATLLLDLLTRQEESYDLQTGELRFDIPRLAARVVGAAEWLTRQPETRGLPIGCFGASTGAAAALVAAARAPRTIRAVVSRGGRPDLAEEALDTVAAPTLLIVGGNDLPVIDLNQQAMARLRCVKEMQIIPGATHLFEERGALEQVAVLASRWFGRHLAPSGGSAAATEGGPP